MYENEMFAGWEIVELLGKDGSEEVYKIRKTDASGREVYSAMKVMAVPASKEEYRIYAEDGYDAESIANIFKNQVTDILNQYKPLYDMRECTNVVGCEEYKVVSQPDGYSYRVFIRMELLKTLPDANREKPLTEKEIVKLGIDICNALLCCEKVGVVHRDIKPQKIFVDDNGNYKLGGFSTAKTMDGTVKATRMGYSAYSAPEVFNSGVYNSNVDIYSVGMVLYWLLNEKRLPFLPLPPAVPTNGQISEAQVKRLRGAPMPEPKNGSSALKAAVLKACAFDPTARFYTVAAFKQSLEAELEGFAAVAAPKPDAVESLPGENNKTEEPKKKSKKWLIILIIAIAASFVLLVIAVIAIIVFFFLFNRTVEDVIRFEDESSAYVSTDAGFNDDREESRYSVDENSSYIDESIYLPPEESYDEPFEESSYLPPEESYDEPSEESYDEPSEESYDVEGYVRYNGAWGDLEWEIYSDGTLLISGEGKMDDLSWYEDVAWAVHRDEITRVIVKEGVTSISAYAFSQHEKVTSVKLPSSVKTLGLNSFRACTSIKELSIPKGVNYIDEDAFAFCTDLETINIPVGVDEISKWLFGYCTSLKTINYDGTVAQWRALPKGLNWFKDTTDFKVQCRDGVINHTISTNYTLAYSAYTVTLTDNGNGTATITAAVPAGVVSGKIVINTSSDLSLVSGSVKGYGAVNENYNSDGVSGACVSFASSSALPNGEIVFSATYTVKDGAVLDFSDFNAPIWDISKSGSTIGTQNTSDVLKKLVK